ncbi:MAG TPA: hypothetical protein VFF69_03220 [Phycisphaerales bacterium]|nr:hypothetical protein [Phycisphaerales bacterium]
MRALATPTTAPLIALLTALALAPAPAQEATQSAPPDAGPNAGQSAAQSAPPQPANEAQDAEAQDPEVHDAEAQDAEAPDADDRSSFDNSTFAPLRARSIGPALVSGRVADFAHDPADPSRFFVAVASGGVWRTTDGGVTYSPVFDSQGSYSIGCVEVDPSSPDTVWVGTGENKSQRSVSFGDGLYKSSDGGDSWENVGLADSEHIGAIAIHPEDTDTVFVAAQGPLWRSGGDRGLYKTTNGGKTWRRVLHISDDTGVNEVHIDPSDPLVMYTVAYQRRRHQWTLVDGGPESAVYRSLDGGDNWSKSSRGLPGGDLGKIGLAISPADPRTVYAIVNATEDNSAFYRSTNKGETWQRMSAYKTDSPQYYNEIVADPHNADRVYLMDTVMQVTEDGGRTWSSVPTQRKHVDSHALWIDPRDQNHLLAGVDGGVYESFSRGQTWRYTPNLPVTQFYKVALDNASPFYNVYGGTQDNNTLGGPSQTFDAAGIASEHWFTVVGGDGFEPAVDPTDENIVYGQSQYGNLVRHDRRTGDSVFIQPAHVPGDPPYYWNWDSPLLISPHDPARIYFAGNFLFRSDDRGDSWTRISDVLNRGIDRDRLEVMGKIQPPEAVDKHLYTSIYGTAVSLAESPLVEGLLYAGTDDGLVHVSEDGGQTWRKIDAFPGVPHKTYVSDLEASRHHPDRVYASFDNHKAGDFTPYLLRSDDRGQTWVSIAGDLPKRDTVYALAEDHELEGLLFVGAEFGAYWTLTGGEKWHKLKGLPTIAVRDVEIQRRENDLVMATFGRGFYILDDYELMRQVDKPALDQPAHLFPIEDALLYPTRSRGTGSQGQTFYSADNPPFGAVINYHVKDELPKSLKEQRKEKAKADPEYHPTIDELRAEDLEQPDAIRLVIRDAEGRVIARLDADGSKGMHRAVWDLRADGSGPVSGGPGYTAPEGAYAAQLVKTVDGVTTALGEPREFRVVDLKMGTFPVDDAPGVLAFQRAVDELAGAVRAAGRVLADAQARLDAIESSIQSSPGADLALLAETHALQERINELDLRLNGDSSAARRMYPTLPGIADRVGYAQGVQRAINTTPTQTMRDQYRYAGEEFKAWLAELRTLVETDLRTLEERLDAAGANWTPGRFPEWDF